MRRRLLTTAVLASAGALVSAGLALAGNGGFAPPAPRSPNGHGIVDAYWLIVGFTAAIFVIVETALVVLVVRFRRGKRGRAVDGPQIRGHTRLELIWTVVPVLILGVIGGFIFYKLPGIKDVPRATASSPRLTVKVVAHQFYWEFDYENGVVSVDRMRAPEGRVVALDVTTPDVAHSWWVPALGGKIDAIPGRTNHTWFKADRSGVYTGQCAEFCGILHAAMTASVEVMPQDAFDAWLSDERRAQAEGTGELGHDTYTGVCSKCHGDRGQGLIGPALTTNPLIGDRAGIETLVREGRGRMPAVGRDWSGSQIGALVAYMKKHVLKGG